MKRLLLIIFWAVIYMAVWWFVITVTLALTMPHVAISFDVAMIILCLLVFSIPAVGGLVVIQGMRGRLPGTARKTPRKE